MLIERTDNLVLRVSAPAKVNLFLEVLNRRADGYHEINSLFQAVSLFDNLTVERVDGPGVELTIVGDNDLTTGPSNLVCRAYELMRREYKLQDGLRVRLEKNIPTAAGLGGGSSDAAAVMLAIDILFDLSLSRRRLQELSARIGSDVPFFFSIGQALVTGRGDVLRETDYPIDYHIVLAWSDLKLSTADSYAALERGLTNSKVPFSLPCCEAVEDFVRNLGHAGNDFEEVHLKSHPELGPIRDALIQRGAVLARMSGSGPTLFGIFTGLPDNSVRTSMNRGSWRFCTVAPITLLVQATNGSGRHRGNHRNSGDATR